MPSRGFADGETDFFSHHNRESAIKIPHSKSCNNMFRTYLLFGQIVLLFIGKLRISKRICMKGMFINEGNAEESDQDIPRQGQKI